MRHALTWLLLTTATCSALTTYAPPPLRVLETPTREEVDACAATMCEGFWTTSQLTPAQVAALHKTQSDDFRTRFSGKRRLRGSLLVVPDDDEGVVVVVGGSVKSVEDGRATIALEVTCAGTKVLGMPRAVVAVDG